MRVSKSVNFYGQKSPNLPRFVYRRLAAALRTDGVDRAAALDAAIEELLGGDDPDLRKFKFNPPDSLRRVLTPQELATLVERIEPRRKRAAQLKAVYPHAADEFSLDRAFLASVLDMDGGPKVAPPARFFTIGSCFARNIAQFIVSNGRKANTFPLAEDLNSPISNAFIFDLLRRPAAEQKEIVDGWTTRIYPEIDPTQAQAFADQKLASVQKLAASLADAECVILTLGNVVDFFREDARPDQPLMEKIVPKFIAMPMNEDIAVRSNSAARLKKQGAALRLATYGETCEAIMACVQGIRAVTSAPIVVTLSPVPVDSVLGLASDLKSAIEVDCVSKSRLRSAFDEVAPQFRAQGGVLHYFPSFEIVRWIAPMLPIPNFGLDDAASRHVSSPILEAVCSLFLEQFVRWPEEAELPAEAAVAQG